MTDLKISGLSAQTTIADDDMFVLETAATTTKKITGANLKTQITTYRAGGTDVAVADGGTGSSTASAARTALGLEIGTDVKAQNAGLTLITTTVLGSAAATFDFAAIPATWSHLRLVWEGATSDSATSLVRIRFNADSSAIYDYQQTYDASATTLAAAEALAQTSFKVGAVPASTATAMCGQGVAEIPFYKGTTFHKRISVQGGYVASTSTGGIQQESYFGRWRSTAAVTQVTVSLAAGNFITGSSASLYGIL